MNKKILTNISRNLQNAALEGAIEDCVASKNDPKKLEILMRLFRDAQVLVPVSFPKNADRTVVMKLLQGQPLNKNENIPLMPVSVRDPEGNLFAPVFTSGDNVREIKDFPYMVRISTDQVIRNVQNEKLNLSGVIINPQTRGFILRAQAFNIDFSKQQQQVKQVTKEELAALARNTAERSLIPKKLFEDKGAFIAELEDRGEEFLSELYAQLCGDKVPSPYTAEDFSLMSLDIDDETTAICIELPEKGIAPHLGISAYIIWNPMTDAVHYYMIEKGERGQDNVLCNVTQDGKHQELMTAPPIGSELTAVLELIKEGEG